MKARIPLALFYLNLCYSYYYVWTQHRLACGMLRLCLMVYTLCMVLFYTLLIIFFFFRHHTLSDCPIWNDIHRHNRKCQLSLLFTSGGRERVGAGHTQYFQRVAGLFDILADIRHNGCATVRWKILQGETGPLINLPPCP